MEFMQIVIATVKFAQSGVEIPSDLSAGMKSRARAYQSYLRRFL